MSTPPPQDRPEQWSQDHSQQQWPPHGQDRPAGPGAPWPQGGAPGPGWSAGGPQPHQQPPSPAPGRGRGVRNTLIGAIAGVLVAALVVGGLTLANVVHWGSGNSAADTSAVELPETLSGLTDAVKVATAKNPQGGAAAGERYQRTYARTAEIYRTAFDGAGVGVRTYAADELTFFLTVVAVRADSPGLVQGGPQADPADLGVAAQPGNSTLVTDGDVQCLQTVTQVVPEGEQVQDEDLLTTVCRTTAEGLTVYVFGGGGSEGNEGKQRMVDLARAARSAITGS